MPPFDARSLAPDPVAGPPAAAAALQDALRARLGRPVRLILTDNRQRLMTCVWRDGVATVRAHRRFAHAPAPVRTALVDLVGAGDEATAATARALLRAWWRSVGGGPAASAEAVGADGPDGDAESGAGDDPAFSDGREIPGAAPRARRPSPAAAPDNAANAVGVTARGVCHDLALYALHLNETYLDGRSRAAVRWGRRPRRRGPTRSIRLGCYFPGRGRILMNRRLDRPDVPRYFIEYVLFHEMLHEVLGIGERPDGRRDIHGPLFKLMERTYPDVDRALAFERRHFGGE